MVLPAATLLMNLSPKLGEFCEMPKRIMNYNSEGKRRVGRHKVKWVDVVNNDFRKASVRHWRREGDDRDRWWRILEEVKMHLGL
jgi:hypothetical protein